MESTELKILDIIRNHATVDDDQISLDSPLSGVGIDSISMIEIIFEIEDAFDIDIPDPVSIEDRFVGTITVRELGEQVIELIRDKDRASANVNDQ